MRHSELFGLLVGVWMIDIRLSSWLFRGSGDSLEEVISAINTHHRTLRTIQKRWNACSAPCSLMVKPHRLDRRFETGGHRPPAPVRLDRRLWCVFAAWPETAPHCAHCAVVRGVTKTWHHDASISNNDKSYSFVVCIDCFFARPFDIFWYLWCKVHFTLLV